MAASNSLLSNDALSLSVAPLGAEMQYLRNAAGDDYLWNGDAAFWTGRAPVLFPIVGRAPGDVVAAGEVSAPMAQHGFARRSAFELVGETATRCHHLLRASEETRAVYPFDYALHVIHRLNGNTVHCEARVENLGQGQMPFGFGFHPAFRWPLPRAGGESHHVTLAAGGSPDRRLLNDGLLTPTPMAGPFVDGRLEIRDDLFKDGALVFPDGSDALHYGPDGGPGLSFRFHNLPDLALWKPLRAPFLCIEPWHGTASCEGDGPQIALRPNSNVLAPGAGMAFGYSVTVEMMPDGQ
ncbi:aldose 1-epimerase family protein [Chachezhania antarctica]|uniref:aldose 1-epimerase family protein n=1 Tax=Chachezhania antarctica TaxID=2340860 RepID=UPI000EAC8331|nr:aldose 1-epimerase family protein [Chachezhania antarctica]|tara:strand:- start:2722 stop:3606 length:885 start_codon:yes stop_codon:yes gene_type:complete